MLGPVNDLYGSTFAPTTGQHRPAALFTLSPVL